MMEGVRRLHPGVVRAILDERDDVLCESLLERCEGPRVVGVVGLGHVDGIERRWKAAMAAAAAKGCGAGQSSAAKTASPAGGDRVEAVGSTNASNS